MARIHVILDDEVIDAINELVGPRGLSRFLEEAAREKLSRVELAGTPASTAGIVKDNAYPEFRDQAAINKWVRAQRRTETS